MVCYNHNPQGVSFESCATRFLCSDAPEPPAPSTRTHRRQSVGTGQGTGTGWTGATYGRWVDYTDGAAVDCDSKTDSNFDCYSIGGNEQSQVAFLLVSLTDGRAGITSRVKLSRMFWIYSQHTRTVAASPPQTEIIARERILWAHKRLVLYYNFALASRQEDALRLINTLFELRFYCFNYVSEWARANWQNNLCCVRVCTWVLVAHTRYSRNGVRATSHLSSRAH